MTALVGDPGGRRDVADRDGQHTVVPTTSAMTRRDLALWAGVLLIVCGMIFRVAIAVRGYLDVDDLVLAQRSLRSGLTLHYLLRPWNNHVMPGGLALYWLFTRWTGLAYWPYLLVTMLGQAAGAVVLFRLLRRMFGRGWAPLLPLAIFQFTALTYEATTIVSTAVMLVPMQLSMVWALYAQVRYIQTRQRRQLASLGLAVSFGLVFFEKSLLVVPLVLLFTACLYASGGPWRSLVQTLRNYWQSWAVLGLLSVIYLAIYLYLSRSGSSLRQPASTSELVSYLHLIIGTNLIPGLFGGPVRWTSSGVGIALGMAPEVFAWLSWLALVVLVVVTVARRPRAVRAWTLLALYACTVVALMAATRLGTAFGAMIGLGMRYVSDVAVLAAICAAAAFWGLPGDLADSRQPPRWAHSRPVVPLGVVVGIAVAVATLVSGVGYERAWSPNFGRDYLKTAQASVAAAPAGTVLLDRKVPNWVIWLVPDEDRMLSGLLAAAKGPQPTFVSAGENVSTIDDNGHLVPAWVTGSSAVPGPAACGWTVGDAPVTVAMDGPLWPQHSAVRIAYQSSADTTATLRLGGVSAQLPVRQGEHQYFFFVEGAGGNSAQLSVVDPHAALCVSGLAVGDVVAAP
jgi:hypothetical protein